MTSGLGYPDNFFNLFGFERIDMKILRLPIKKKWFDMIKSGEKREEYRAVSAHWIKRLLNVDSRAIPGIIADAKALGGSSSLEDMLLYHNAGIKHYDVVRLVNGYGKTRPTVDMAIRYITIGAGDVNWGAERGVCYFVIGLGKVL